MAPPASFRESLLKGLAPDGGLYLPDSLPVLTNDELNGFTVKEYHEIAFTILNKVLGSEVDSGNLKSMCADAYNFEIPLEKVTGRKYVMRLDQGPTASFKDFAARMMSRLMQYFLAKENKHLTILTATSGDTGSAVANAFYRQDNIKAIILYPASEVTEMQRRQMTTLNGNIRILAVNGKFDDCQRLVKQAFLDPKLAQLNLSSANSINIGRLLPQSVYYFYAYAKLAQSIDEKAIFSVPSGNFGNLMGGLIARRMGLPVEKFIIATNENDEVPEFLKTDRYEPIDPSINCISSAMNVGHPSNLARIVAFYGGIMNERGVLLSSPDMNRMRNDLASIRVSDDETRNTIEEAYRIFNLLLEPHGAIAWKGVIEFASKNPSFDDSLFISLETAHPAKFPEEVFKILKIYPELPPSLSGLDQKSETFFSIENDYDSLKRYILKV
jgi:threonine synthase